MAGNLALQSKRVERLTLAVCLVVSVGLLSLPERQRIQVADLLGMVLTSPYYRTVDFGREVLRTAGENDRLRAEVATLRLQQSAAMRFRRDRDGLRRALGLMDIAPTALVPCEVERRRVSSSATLVRVRTAENVAWRRYQPVISADGLIGRVHTPTGTRTAWVELLTSTGLAVTCELDRTGLTGILQSRGGDFDLTFIGRDEDVRVGDVVVTSDIALVSGEDELVGAGLPRGLPVGTVVEVSSPPDQIFKSVRVEPQASFSTLDVLFVVMGRGDWFITQVTPAVADSASVAPAEEAGP